MECCVQFHLTRLLGLTLHCTYLSLPYLNMYVYKYILIIILICSSILPCWPVGPSQQLLLVFGCECIVSNRPWTPKHCTGCSHCTTRASGSSLHTFTIPFMSTSAKIHDFLVWWPILLNFFFWGHWTRTLATQPLTNPAELISEDPFLLMDLDSGCARLTCHSSRHPLQKSKREKVVCMKDDESAYKHPIVESNLNFWRHLDRPHHIRTIKPKNILKLLVY